MPSVNPTARVLLFEWALSDLTKPDGAHAVAAKAEAAALIERLGFAGIDLGSLSVGGKLAQFPGGPFPAPPASRRGTSTSARRSFRAVR